MNARVNVFRIFVFKHWIRCREKWCGGLAKRPFLKKDVDLEKYSVQETKFHSSHTTCSKFGPLIIYFRQMAQLIRKPLKTFAVLRWMIAVFPFVSVGGFFLLEGVFPSHHCKVLDCWAPFTLQCEATWLLCFGIGSYVKFFWHECLYQIYCKNHDIHARTFLSKSMLITSQYDGQH